MASIRQEWRLSSIEQVASQEQEVLEVMATDTDMDGAVDTLDGHLEAFHCKRYQAIFLNPECTGPVIQHGIMTDFLDEKDDGLKHKLYHFRLSILCRKILAWFGVGENDDWIVYMFKGGSSHSIRLLPDAYHFWEVLYDYAYPSTSKRTLIDSEVVFLVEIVRDSASPSPPYSPTLSSSSSTSSAQVSPRSPQRSVGIQVSLVAKAVPPVSSPPSKAQSNPRSNLKPKSQLPKCTASIKAPSRTTDPSPGKRPTKPSQPRARGPKTVAQSQLPASGSVRPSPAICRKPTKSAPTSSNSVGQMRVEKPLAGSGPSTTPRKPDATPSPPKEVSSDEAQVDVPRRKQQNDIAKNEALAYPFRHEPQQDSLLSQLHAQATVEDDDDLLAEGSDLTKILPTAESPTEKQWAKCCRLLLLDPEEHKDPRKRSIRIPHTSIRLTPRQYWTAYEMLVSHQRRSMCGGILADGAGTGKTWVVLGYLVLRVLILTNIAEVQSDWAKNKTSRHSPEPPRGRGHIPCKCNNSMGIECFADPYSVPSDIEEELVRGPALIQVGSGVIEEWKQALLDCKLSTTYFHPVLFHTNAPPALKPPADLKTQLKTRIEPYIGAKVFSPSEQPLHKDLLFIFDPETRYGKQPERFIFLTTYDAKLLEAEFQVPVEVPIEPLSDGDEDTPRATVQKHVYCCPVGVHVVDEFHKVRHRQSTPVRLAHMHHDIMGQWDSDFWSVTATPMPNNLMDIYTTLEILQRGWWGPRHDVHGTKQLLALIAMHEAANAPDATPETQWKFEEELLYFFHRGLVIRNDEATDFFDQPITDLKPVKPELLVYGTPQVFLQDVQKIAHDIKVEISEMHSDPNKALRSKAAFEKMEVLQVLSTFPGAAKLVLDGTINLTKPALRDAIATLRDRRDVSQVPLFRECFGAVVRDSSKLSAILESINFMMDDPEERPEQVISEIDAKKEWFKPNDRKMKKMVILTPSLGEAIFIYMAVRKFMAKCRPVLFHHDLKASEKTEVLSDWSILTDRAKYRVFIAPFDLAGTGLNLQTANYQILTGPLRFKSDEVQCFRRTNREGQQLSLVHLLLATEDNPHDRLVLARQAMRSITSDPFSLPTALELSPSRTR